MDLSGNSKFSYSFCKYNITYLEKVSNKCAINLVFPDITQQISDGTLQEAYRTKFEKSLYASDQLLSK